MKRQIKKSIMMIFSAGILSFFLISIAGAHCEIPCGIYDDQLRTKLITEHIATIEKSMNQIVALSNEKPINYNQLIRWVTNKDTHATEIQHIVSQYFMTQRIKPDQKTYADMLKTLHEMLVTAMKCKQSTDLGHIKTLRSLLNRFETLYFQHEH